PRFDVPGEEREVGHPRPPVDRGVAEPEPVREVPADRIEPGLRAADAPDVFARAEVALIDASEDAEVADDDDVEVADLEAGPLDERVGESAVERARELTGDPVLGPPDPERALRAGRARDLGERIQLPAGEDLAAPRCTYTLDPCTGASHGLEDPEVGLAEQVGQLLELHPEAEVG